MHNFSEPARPTNAASALKLLGTDQVRLDAYGDPMPPYNLEAEQALLGALLIANQSAEYIPDLLHEHFFDGLHGQIFRAISDAISSGRKVSAVTLADKFRHVKVTEDLNGAQYLGRLIANATGAMSIRDYARTIIELSQRRQLIVIAEDMASMAFAPDGPAPAVLIEQFERRLYSAAARDRSIAEVSYAQAMRKSVDRAAEAYQRGGKLAGLSTGLTDLDNRLGGLSNSDLIILAGRPSMGKSALAMNIAASVAEGSTRVDPATGKVLDGSGGHVHFFSLEMSDEQLASRHIAEAAEIAGERLRRGDFEERDFRRIAETADRLSKLSITIDPTGGLTIAQLATKARREKRRAGTSLIVIDYLQLMSGSARNGGNRVQEITEITTGLKALAKELNVPIIALSQLSRKVEERTDKRPQLSDLRESGSIEQDADVVLFVYREQYYVEREKPGNMASQEFLDWQAKLAQCAGKAEVIIGKQRHGPVGIVELAFDGAKTRFSDIAHEVMP